MKHKHAAVIKAWADGAEIEYRISGTSDWKRAYEPVWNFYNEYRVKPSYPTLGEIAKKAWETTYISKSVGVDLKQRWQDAADAVVAALRSGEYS